MRSPIPRLRAVNLRVARAALWITAVLVLLCALDLESVHAPLDAGGADSSRSSPACICEAAAPGPALIHDRKLLKDFTRRATKLLSESKLAASPEDLGKQLKRASCKLSIPLAGKVEIEGEDLYDESLESVLMVGRMYKGKAGLTANIASGFVISASGAVVTNYHVVNNAVNAGNCAGIVVMNGKGTMWVVSEVLAANKSADICIIQLAGKDFRPIPLSRRVRAGGEVRTISHPAGRYFCMTGGIVSRKYSRGGAVEWINIDADYCRGSSGGPILDKNGNVVGLVVSTKSIYYSGKNNLQMVFKNVSSAANLLRMIDEE